MAQRDASRVQLDFPQLTADIIAQLRLTGVVGLLDFLDQIRPVYIVAAREGALTVVASGPLYTSASIFSGSVVNPVALATIANTGPLAAGDYDIWANMNVVGNIATTEPLSLEHRNAADNATLATLLQVSLAGGNLSGNNALPVVGYTLAANERFRMTNRGGLVNGQMSGSIGILIRPTP